MSRIESFTRMFDREFAHGAVVTRVEIPLIQRDYAQGRRGEKVDDIRRSFLAALHSAIAGDNPTPLALDFVYGEQRSDGSLQPLDGQQRLTTLFLLHWYIAGRSGHLEQATGWTSFSYETRPSARRFCQRLARAVPEYGAMNVSEWIRNQPWYLYVWRYDPTIDAMLVMIDAIDEQFREVDPYRAWERLSAPDTPAIYFHLLPLPDMGSADDLYVKMNSRGKPLTEFENFKARFERVIDWSPRAADFAHLADTTWSDILWRVRGDDDLIDDEFLRYFDFITEICEWSAGEFDQRADGSRLNRASRIFGADNPQREKNLDFLFRAFNVWDQRDIAGLFGGLFRTTTEPEHESTALPIFFQDPNRDLFESCCRSYGATAGSRRLFTFGQTLLLYAVILHLDGGSEDFSRRLRTLRNLIEGSQFEMRAERMPRLVADTRALILDGFLPDAGRTFAVAQLSDEEEKRRFVAAYPEAEGALQKLEDNPQLKGSVTAFTLDASRLSSRTEIFNELLVDPSLWWDLTGALLAVGEYQRPRDRSNQLDDSDSFQFGTWDGRYRDAWRAALTGRTRSETTTTATVLAELLDRIAEANRPVRDALVEIQRSWLEEQEAAETFDWRYYLVKYRSARKGASGIYFAQGKKMGFSLANLPGGKERQSAFYHDPYLESIYREMGSPGGVKDEWYTGYVSDPRWLRLAASGTGLRSVPRGFQILPPLEERYRVLFEDVTESAREVRLGDESGGLVIAVSKSTEDVDGPDAEDRIQVGARILGRLLDAGL